MSQPIRASFALPGHIEDNSQLLNLGPSEQVYGHSAGVCRALPLGVVRREWPHPWQVRQRHGWARQAPPKGAYSQSRSLRCTDLKGRHLTAPVRLDSEIGCKPEWSYTCSESPNWFYRDLWSQSLLTRSSATCLSPCIRIYSEA
jgi:hypothetical protein